MPLVICEDCKHSVSDQAPACPKCGRPMNVGGSQSASAAVGQIFGAPGMPVMMFRSGYEYKSKLTIFGLPVICIAGGFNPETGAKRVAKGIIAIGDIALGVVALGGLSVGVASMGGLALGGLAVGGAGIGVLLGVGGLGVGYVAVGGAAIGYYAMGAMAIGAKTLGTMGQDPEAVEFFSKFFGAQFKGILQQMPKVPNFSR